MVIIRRQGQRAAWLCIAAALWVGGCSTDDGSKPSAGGAAGATVQVPTTSASATAGSASTLNPSTGTSAIAGNAAPAGNQTPPAGTGVVPTKPPTASGAAGTMASTTPPPPPAANGGGTPVMTPPAAPMVPLDAGKTCLKPGDPTYATAGPYKVAMMEVDLGMIEASQHTGKFTIYYPSPLETSCPHPIVAWGNGTGVQGAGVYAFLNSNAASWGIVVAEAEEDNTGSGNFHKAGIDWLLKQNDDPMSMFYKKLSTRAGVSGHSQGGFGATAGSAHPNVVTEAIEGATNVATAKVSVLILTGTMDIVMGAEGLVANAKGPMFVADWENGDHVTTETIAGFIGGDKGSLQFQRLYAAWFRCLLGDDATACKLFQGGAPDNCGICKDPGWHGLASKNL